MNRVFHVLLATICTLNIVIHVRSFGLLQELSEPVHHICLMLHKGMGITVKRDSRVFMPQYLGQSFYVHAAFEGAGSKRVPQRMKPFVGNFQPFQEQFKTSLVGTNGYGLSIT